MHPKHGFKKEHDDNIMTISCHGIKAESINSSDIARFHQQFPGPDKWISLHSTRLVECPKGPSIPSPLGNHGKSCSRFGDIDIGDQRGTLRFPHSEAKALRDAHVHPRKMCLSQGCSKAACHVQPIRAGHLCADMPGNLLVSN